jgi:hypothetical protein
MALTDAQAVNRSFHVLTFLERAPREDTMGLTGAGAVIGAASTLNR